MIDAKEALTTVFGLRKEHWAIIYRVGWVVFVTYNIFRMLGWLAAAGIASPFANAADVDKLLRAQAISARIAMQQEIRVQTRVWCTHPDHDVRDLAYRRIDELRENLRDIANVQTPEPNCTVGTP